MNQFIFRQSAGLELLICEPLEQQGFTNAFTTRSGGVSPLPSASLNLGNFSQDLQANVVENRRRLKTALGEPNWPILTMQQTHSADVRNIIEPAQTELFSSLQPPAGDALTTSFSRILLAVQTADCLPVLIADRRSGATAAVHAGWRGTASGIVARTVEQMQQHLGADPSNLHAAIGPAIGPCCFEVGPEVVAAFRQRWNHVDLLVSLPRADGRVNLDLRLANRLQLVAAGVSDSSIYDCNLCTICQNDKFFSYRLEKGAVRPVGRLMGLIGWSDFNE
ncbi:MAG: peptidoglycan editing factor PgeF [Acidobacteria bacterium]|nr:peptidoglycan editing factor PgeF [Acidobacteriota bacterium]